MPWAERVRAFEERGFHCIQSGVWMDRVPRACFGTDEEAATVFEIYDIPEDFASMEF